MRCPNFPDDSAGTVVSAPRDNFNPFGSGDSLAPGAATLGANQAGLPNDFQQATDTRAQGQQLATANQQSQMGSSSIAAKPININPPNACSRSGGAGSNVCSGEYWSGSDELFKLVEETLRQYKNNLRRMGVDPDNTRVDAARQRIIDAITSSVGFNGAAKPIFNQDVAAGRETGGIQVYMKSDGTVVVVPYVGIPAVCSSSAVACMAVPNPDTSQGALVLEWHPHPIGQEGSDLPSEKDLLRSMKLGAPGVIWSKDGATYKQIEYQGHPLAPD